MLFFFCPKNVWKWWKKQRSAWGLVLAALEASSCVCAFFFIHLLFLWCRSCPSGCTAWRSTASRPSGGSSEERSGTCCARGWTPAPTTWTRWSTSTGSQINVEVQALTAAVLLVALHWNAALHHPALPAAHHSSLLPGLHSGKTA